MTEEQVRQIRAWWEIFQQGERMTEIRIIGRYTWSGYYKNVENLIRDVSAHEGEGAVYFIINDPAPACYDKQQREMIVSDKKLSTTTDREIAGYRFVFLDIDCNHGVTDVNSNDAEKHLAHLKAVDIWRFLKAEGFNDPIVNDSANGYHIYIPCRLENTEENRTLVKKFTLAMGMMFSDENVKIDPVVANPARIAKLPGTFSFKGSADSVERPRRMCRILLSPEAVKANDRAYFEKIAKLFPEPEKPSFSNNFSSERFDLDAFIQRHGIQVTKKVEVAEGTRYILDHCLFNEAHKGRDAVLFQHNSGAVAYFCYHASCAGNDWHRLREMLEPGCYDKHFGQQPRTRRLLFRDENPPQPQVETVDKGPKWRKMSQIPKPEFDPSAYIPSGISQIDDLIIGWKRGQVTLWSGYRGSAKSTLLSELVLNAANRGYKSAVWTGELDGSEFKNWLYLQAAGKAYNKKSKYNQFYFTPKDIAEKIDPWADKYIYLYNNEYSDNFDIIEQEIRQLVKEQEVDQVFLDNLTILDIDSLDDSIFQAQKEFMKRTHYLARELNVHIHCVAHPNKSGGFLRQNSISGSGHLPDIAQNVLIIHKINRDFETSAKEFLSKHTVSDIVDSGCTNCIEICKCRDKGSATDTFVKLWFEMESNRLKNDIAEQIRYGWEDEAGMPKQEPAHEWTTAELVDYHNKNQADEDMPSFENGQGF